MYYDLKQVVHTRFLKLLFSDFTVRVVVVGCLNSLLMYE